MTSEFSQSERNAELITASALKLHVAKILTSDRAGRLIGAVTRKRIRHQGIWFDTRGSNFSPSVRAQMFWGGYESAETRMIHKVLRGSATVVELGSSLGVTAAHVGSVMVPGGHLICVEANPRLLPGLRMMTLRHASKLRVDVVHGAVTDHCGTTVLAIASQTVGSRVTAAPRPNESTVEVPALTLREILRRTSVAEFDLVSDIEGSETAFLMLDSEVLKACRRVIIELHETTLGGHKFTVSDLISAAIDAGFQIIDRHGPVLALERS